MRDTIMQPNSSAHFQALLANAIRNTGADIPQSINSEQLAVYQRLIVNNLREFINRCFSDSRHFIDTDQWNNLQKQFLANTSLESPYFNDIPVQFLHYIHHAHNTQLPEGVLEMMDFEVTLLNAEIAITPSHQANTTWNEQTVLSWSPSAFLKTYSHDFINSHLAEIIPQSGTNAIIWRNAEDEVYYQALDTIEWLLLNHFNEQTDSIHNLYQQLLTLTSNQIDQQWLIGIIKKWVDANVLVPTLR